MSKIAFVGNLFHQQTASSYFFIELLQKRYEVDFYWGLPRNQLEEIDFATLNSIKYDSIICWQVMPEAAILMGARCSNIIMVPMYDNSYDVPDSHWNLYREFKFLNFSSALHDRLERLGLTSRYCQYFPAAEEGAPTHGLKGFFWQRKKEVTWIEIRELIKNSHFDSFHIHRAVDPKIEFIPPSPDDIKQYNISFSDWFETKEAYMAKVKECTIFFAPRLYEGIGLSFLEAMAMGKCVVAPNTPTMNEYIVDGHNGVLYDHDMLNPVDLHNRSLIGQCARTTISEGHKKWLADEYEIIRFIEEKPAEGNWLLKKLSFFRGGTPKNRYGQYSKK